MSAFSTVALPMAKRVNGRFVCPWGGEKPLFDALKYVLSSKQMRIDLKEIPDTSKLIKAATVDRAKCTSTTQPHATWIGHATCLYQTDGLFFLTDPVWSRRCSPSQWAGPQRFVEPPIAIEDLKIDVVLLSHTHYDHLDQASAERIGNRALWYVKPPAMNNVL